MISGSTSAYSSSKM